MATDYAEKERAFIASLEAETGKGLDAWMLAITEASLANRNDIIDWLRLQRFQFAKASWLERIHHNGGRLIYADYPAAKRRIADQENDALPPSVPAETAAVGARPPSQVTGDVATLLLAAKGLRPLADFILQEIGRSIPNVAYGARAPLIIALAPKPFAALLPGAKQLKVYADFERVNNAEIKLADGVLKATPPFPAMIVVNDARRVDRAFLELIAAAHARAHA